ncbi:MAG: hypothetical protein ACOCQ4_02400 [bacterium]
MKKLFLVALIFGVLLLSACGTVDVEQKLYKDGTFDLSIEVTSENEMFIDLFEGQLNDLEGAELTELDNGVRYSYEGVSFSNGEFNNSFSKMWGISKEYHFPYNHIILNFNNTVASEEEDSFGMDPEFYYTIEPFGKIVDTNGIYLEDKSKVRFDLMKEKDYFIEFKYFCLIPAFCAGDKIPERESQNTSFGLSDDSLNNSPLDDSFGGDSLADVEPEKPDYGPVTHLDASCGYSANWDADAEDDGIYFYVRPLDDDENVVPLEGEVSLKIKDLFPHDMGFEFMEDEVVHSDSYVLKGESRLDDFDDWDGYKLKLNWEDISDYSSDASDFGNFYIDFEDLNGSEYSAKIEHTFMGDCRIRPS